MVANHTKILVRYLEKTLYFIIILHILCIFVIKFNKYTKKKQQRKRSTLSLWNKLFIINYRFQFNGAAKVLGIYNLYHTNKLAVMKEQEADLTGDLELDVAPLQKMPYSNSHDSSFPSYISSKFISTYTLSYDYAQDILSRPDGFYPCVSLFGVILMVLIVITILGGENSAIDVSTYDISSRPHNLRMLITHRTEDANNEGSLSTMPLLYSKTIKDRSIDVSALRVFRTLFTTNALTKLPFSLSCL